MTPITLHDNMEDVVRAVRTRLRTSVNTYIAEKFTAKSALDITEYGSAISPPVIDNSNILIGDLSTIKISLQRLPCILIDYDVERYDKTLTMRAHNNKMYSINIYPCIIYESPEYLSWGILRTVFGIVQLLSDYSALDGSVNDGAVQQITYSLPIQFQAGWFRGAAIQMNYNGLVF